MDNAITYMLGGTAIALLALIPAFLVAARQARKTRQQNEVAAFNAEVARKRADKQARKSSQREAR